MFRKQANYAFFILALAFAVAGMPHWLSGPDTKHRVKIPKRDRMDLAWQLEFDLTRDPATMTIPRERLFVAYEYARSLQTSSNRVAGAIPGISWKERGPDNVAGRTRSLVVSSLDPSGQTVFAAGVGGGIWKTTNISAAAPNWTPVNDLFANIAITTIAQDPSDGNLMYFGTGEGWSNADAVRGDGIWKSTDGGATFTQMAGTGSNANFHFVNKIVVHPITGDVYAATNNGLFRYTIASGIWTKVLGNGVGAAINQIADIEVASDNALIASTGKIFAGADGVYRSVSGNAGAWVKLNNGSNGFPTSGFARLEIATAPSNPAVIYVLAMSSSTNGILNIYRTGNTGSTWNTCALPVDADGGIGSDFTRGQAWYDMSVGVDPNNENTLIVGGIDLFRSTTGGSSWTQLTHWYGGFGFQNVHADQHAVIYRNSSEVYFTNDGGVFRSTNGGTTIAFAGNNYNVTQYYACAINPTYGSNQFLAGAQDNGSQKYTLPGINSTIEVTGGDGAFCHIDQLNPNLQFTSYVYNNIYRSTDGGNSFTSIRNNNNGSFINPSDFDDINKVFYGTYSTGAYTYLTNAISNTTWNDNTSISAFNGARVTAITCSPLTPYRVFFGLSNGRVVRADNANTAAPTYTVMNIMSPMLGSASVSGIAVENDDDNHLLVTFSNYGWASVWETKNGSTWQNCEGNLPDMPVRGCLFNPDDSSSALIATELGVWSTDELNGINTVWGPSNTGLANVRTDMLQIRSSDKMIIAATHGRGLYSTDYFAPPFADFAADRIITYVNKPLQFTDGSVKATSWNWSFGDATTSTVQHPLKTYTAPGIYTVTLQINNNGTLVKTRNNYITVLPDRGTPYSPATGGNFDVAPNDFAAEGISGTNWQKGSSPTADKNGTRSGANAWVTGLFGNYTNSSHAKLYTPSYDFSTAGFYTLRFYRKNRFELGYDGYRVEYSLNKGDTWTILGTPQTNWYDWPNPFFSAFPSGEPYFNATNNTVFTLASLDVSFLAGNANVAFRFVFRSDDFVTAPGVAIDDFEILGPNTTQLPVSMGSFDGERKGKDNILNWTTYSEEDNRGFYVERSVNGTDFDPIGFVNGAGTVNTLQRYSFTDRNVPGSVHYYRLRQVDFDGDFAWSKTIALSGRNAEDEWLQLFPVPVRSTLNILFNEVPEGPVNVQIYSGNGEMILRTSLSVSGGGLSIPLEDLKLAGGVYFISVESAGKRFSGKFLQY